MSPVTWYLASLLGVFSKMLVLFIGAVIIQIVICHYWYQKGKIIPLLAAFYLIINEIYYFYSIRHLIEVNPNVILYGILLIIPYGSILLATSIICFFYSKKRNKYKELNKTKIMDL